MGQFWTVTEEDVFQTVLLSLDPLLRPDPVVLALGDSFLKERNKREVWGIFLEMRPIKHSFQSSDLILREKGW